MFKRMLKMLSELMEEVEKHTIMPNICSRDRICALNQVETTFVKIGLVF